MKSSNKAKEQQAGAAEKMEGSMPAKENVKQTSTSLAQDGRGVSQGLIGVRKAAEEKKELQFTSLLHACKASSNR
jgi:hypothetical protein